MIVDQFGAMLSTDDPDMELIRKQYAAQRADQYAELSWIVHPASLGRLSFNMLRHLYEVSSSIRPAVDSIAREVSSLPWMVIKKDMMYHPPKDTERVEYFLHHPNLDREKFRSIIEKFIHDSLVVGKGVIEKVRNPMGQLKELMARDATLYTPQVNSFGFIVNYLEYKKDTMTVTRTHPSDNIIFEPFTPTANSLGAVPIIETIVNEVALLMLCTKSLAYAFTSDEIPPGILMIGKIGEAALNRAKASFEAAKGIATQHKLRVIDNVEGDVKWVEFHHSNQEMQVAELIPMIERVVYRNFGLSPVESSQTDISRQVAGVSFKSSQSKMVGPVMGKIEDIINIDVVEELDPTCLFKFTRNPQESLSEQSKPITDLSDRAIITTNEARIALGLRPVRHGDVRSHRFGNEVGVIDETTGEIKYRAKPIASKPKPVV